MVLRNLLWLAPGTLEDIVYRLAFRHLPTGMSFFPSNHTPEPSLESDVTQGSWPLGDLS